jgi:large subunit ribosomal protein L21
MYAVVDIAGFQEKVSKGDSLKVPLQDSVAGKAVVFEKVLMLADGDNVQVGMPFIAGASVEATVVSHGRHDKIRVQKMHKRKRYRRVHGHKQDFTLIEVTGINAK